MTACIVFITGMGTIWALGLILDELKAIKAELKEANGWLKSIEGNQP